MRWLLRFFAVLAVLALVVWLSLGFIAEQGISYVLGKRDIPVKSYRLEKLSRTHLVLRDVVMGEEGAVKAGRADIRLGWDGKTLRSIDVTLEDADITALQDAEGLRLDGVERLWQASPPPAGADAMAIQWLGNLTAHYALEVGAFKVQSTQGDLYLRRENKALIIPLALVLKLDGTLDGPATYEGTLQHEKQLSASFKGNYDLAKKQGTTQWDIASIRFAPDGFRFSDLSPYYASEVPTFPMHVNAKGSFALSEKGWALKPTVKFLDLPLGALLAAALGDDATVDGTVTGSVPLEITDKGWRIAPAQMRNKGGLRIAVSPVGTTADLVQSHPQSQLVLSALSNFVVDTMRLDLRSTDAEGGVHFNWHFLGANPELYGGKKVDFTLAVNANLENIWLSVAGAEALATKAATAKGANK